jgi:hypothetical protein
MSDSLAAVSSALAWNDSELPVVKVGSRDLATVSDLLAAGPSAEEMPLGAWCEAINHLEHGDEYAVIHDPAEFIARYEARLAAEDPSVPFQEGVTRLCDFGRAETSLIQPPQRQGETVLFFAEDLLLGIPYQVTAPAPGGAGEKVIYAPVPTVPVEGTYS